jgi:TolB-like protein/Tfp pilus assembly protein PilF
MMRHSLAILLLVAMRAPLAAQCPDGSPPPCTRTRTSPPNSVAVLYFENLGRDTADAYIADGLTEEVTSRLGQVSRLAVTSRMAVRRLHNAGNLPTADIGHALGAAYLVNGSVRRAGDRVRVTIELVRASSGARVWGDQYDRGTNDLLAIQEDIARAVATGVAGQLLPAERASLAARPTRNAEAYDHYLRGLRALRVSNPATTLVAVDENERALALDSNFTDARANLALAYVDALNWAAYQPGASNAEYLPRSLAAADRALRENPRLSQAWLARGVYYLFMRPRTFDGAEDALRRAVSLDPDNALAYHWLALTLRRLGDFDAAWGYYERASSIDPTLVLPLADRGFIAYQRRQYAETIRWYDSASVIDSTSYPNFLFGSRAAFALGDTARALRYARTGVRRSNGNITARAVLAQIEGLSGMAEARAYGDSVVAPYEQSDSLGVREGYDLVLALLATGQRDRALALLEKVKPVGPWLWSYLVFPDFDPVRRDPRFERVYRASRPQRAVDPP